VLEKHKEAVSLSKESAIRTPIVAVLGHVDHGKTSLLDRIRGSSVVKTESGAITQHIGATLVPIDAIRKMSGSMEKMPLNVPGLLFIDTPGHHAFTTLRARGGALADMAILVVDISQGFQPQTIEAIQILRTYRTPFVVAATKIDRVHGWRPYKDEPFLSSFARQSDRVKDLVEMKLYEIVAKVSEFGFSCERFDRVSDFQRNLAIVPLSAHTGEGIAELLMVMIGLAQRYMEQDLALSVDVPGVGTVLEVKEERGLGTTLDVILYNGTLSVGDEVAIARSDGVSQTKVRSLLKPRPMKDSSRQVRAAGARSGCGIKVSAPNLEGVIAGSPIRVIRGWQVKEEIRRAMEEIKVKISRRADTKVTLSVPRGHLQRLEEGDGVMRAGSRSGQQA
jgi:translation initiation factor 5B